MEIFPIYMRDEKVRTHLRKKWARVAHTSGEPNWEIEHIIYRRHRLVFVSLLTPYLSLQCVLPETFRCLGGRRPLIETLE
jgi:hypothetical protein